MTSARQQLLDIVVEPDAYNRPPRELQPLQLQAAREVFAERREQIAVLRRRADETGVREIRRFEDIVPLLFSHTVYKSYPASFVEQGRWDRMLTWLKTLSTQDPTTVDVKGVTGVDDWIERLEQAGHLVLATSGSSGKCSFLNATRNDFELKRRHFAHTLGFPWFKPKGDRVVFMLGPSNGPNSAVEASRIGAEVWGRPDSIHFLTDEPLRISEVSAMAAMRKRMQDGLATPQEIADFEARSAAQGRRMQQAMQELCDKILAHRHEPMALMGLWAQHMMIIRRARELHIKDGDFHPDSHIAAGGGVKGVALPADYKEQVDRFYGNVRRGTGYGMTEQAQVMPRCEKLRYHVPPGLIMLLLDQPGEKLIAREPGSGGVVEGRYAFLDLLYEGRWGGLISGDRIEVDFAERCPCGRYGPTILDTIVRYSQAGADDHIGCAGTIDAYVRGAMDA
ncbi:MAG: hypothetical protein WB646_02940 [Steroidobacteraceae bacterium]